MGIHAVNQGLRSVSPADVIKITLWQARRIPLIAASKLLEKCIKFTAVLVFASFVVPAAMASEPEIPMNDAYVHLGVATCAGSNCHGATRPFDTSPVSQNEYFIWERHDRHARAFATLKTERSRNMASKLGLADPAAAPMCLNCHTDNVPESRRGNRFLLSDGVGCEACHGGSEQWLGPHVSGLSSHADNLALGLYPTEDPQARAQLCLGCHQGDAEHPMTHALMGAGHPQLVFELDTFTAIQPAHFKVDADYRARKVHADSTTTYAVGQVEAGLRFTDLLAGMPQHSGLFPELYPFDCNACHHDTDQIRWNNGLGGTGRPGEVRLRSAELRSAGMVLSLRDATLGRRWQQQVDQLHAASQQSMAQLKVAAQAFERELGTAARSAAAQPWQAGESRALLRALIVQLQGDAGADFTHAEQATMALAGLATQVPPADSGALEARMDAVYAAVSDRRNYTPEELRTALQGLAALYAR